MPRYPSPFLAFLCLTATPCVFATEPALAPVTFTEALKWTAERNPQLIALGHQERAVEARIEQAGVRPNPTLDLLAENFAGTGAMEGVDGLETTVQISQTLERGGKRIKRLALARHEHESATRELTVRRTEMLASAACAYVETLAADRRLALAGEALNLARETVAAVDTRVRSAMGSTADTARARTTLASARAEHARAEVALTTARATLAAAWGDSTSTAGRPVGSLPVPAELPSPETFLAKLSAHPRLDLQQAIIASHRASLTLERARSRQDVTVGGGVRFLREGSDTALVAGVSIPLPFRNQNQGNVRAARETLAGAEQGVQAIELELRTRFTTAWRELQSFHAIARELRRDALPASEEACAIVRRAFDEGQLPLIDVIDAQRALITLRREILDAEIACALALVRVEGLVDSTFPVTTALLSSQ
jgi:cobalt-zinc-cadmium efflux system outer membrane protein